MTDISIEEAVRQTMDALGIEDDEDRIESAVTEIAVLASAFAHQRHYNVGWEERFAGQYVRPIGFGGCASLLTVLTLQDRPIPRKANDQSLIHIDISPDSFVYLAAEAWLTLIIKNVFVRLGR